MRSPDSLRIAVVEDDPIMGESLIQRLALEGYDAVWCQTGVQALEALRQRRPDLMVCDIRLPDMSGEELFGRMLASAGQSPTLFITAYGDIDQAVRLMRAGAADYLTKPFPMERFLDRIEELLRGSSAEQRGAALGQSDAMQRIEALLRRVADIDSTLLLTGESGVGKEVAAHFVHEVSKRANRPFIAVNCAAIPGELLESELFGHEKGAFTGAHARHEGYAERARDGILLLDEISELSPALQATLLRLVQERTFLRVGGEKPQQFTARLMCSSNGDLESLVANGRFRRDLYYRINVIPVHIPALRERRDDILPLLRRYAAHFSETFGRPIEGIRESVEPIALHYQWPGNVRELRNRMERAVALAPVPWLEPSDLFPEFAQPVDVAAAMAPLAIARNAAERQHILAALEQTGGQIRKAAELLGISRTTLWEKMRKLGIPGDSER
jgi:DNA-binding NtrC family response regulator